MKNKPKKNKKSWVWLRSLLIGVILSSAMVFLYTHQFNILQQFEKNVYDIYLRNIKHDAPSEDVIVLDIDEASLNEFGQWPWPRYMLAELIEKLNTKEAAAVALDIILSEPDRISPKRIAHSMIQGVSIYIPMDSLSPELRDYDVYLARTLKRTPSVLGFYIWGEGETVSYEEKPKGINVVTQVMDGGSPDNITMGQGLAKARSANLPVPVLYGDRSSVGFVNADTDADGVIRTVPLLMQFDGRIYPSLALAAFMKANKISLVTMRYDFGDLVEIKVGKYVIPVGNEARIHVPFKGGHGSYKYYSAADLLNDRIDDVLINGKIVFIGSSAIALQDIRSTPWDRRYPGVEVHASIIDAISNNNFIRVPIHTPGIQTFAIFILGVIGALMFGNLRASVYLPISILIIGAVITISYRLFGMGIYISPVYVVVTIGLQAAIILGIRFWQEERRKRFIQSAFGKYVAPEVVNSIAEQDDDFLSGQKRTLSILFSDIRGFTSMSEKLDPQQVVELLNEYFTPMTAIIRNTHGTIDKFIGDAIMAFWNAPLDVDAHAQMAVISALQMHTALNEMNPAIKERYGFAISMGVGIHSGSTYVGNMGSTDMLNYTVIGDCVNIASRLEGLCKEYGVGVVVSADTVALCMEEGGDFSYRFIFIDSIIVKGRYTALDIYMPLTVEECNMLQEELNTYDQAREAYVQGDFKEAKRLFAILLPLNKKLYSVYHERACELSENPPSEWNGVWKFSTK